MLRIDGIVFEPPAGFEPSETMITLTTPPPAEAGGAGDSGSKRPRAVRPNLILQSRPARPGAELGVLAGEYMAELAQAVPGLEKMSGVPFVFDDSSEGILIAYDFPMPAPPGGPAHATAKEGAGGPPPGARGLAMRQYHVLRLDEGRLTTMTLTVPSAGLTAAQGESYLKAFASAKKVERRK